MDAAERRLLLVAHASRRRGRLAFRAVEEGIAIVPGGPFYPDGRGTSNVRLSFSNVGDELIDVGIERLGALVRERPV